MSRPGPGLAWLAVAVGVAVFVTAVWLLGSGRDSEPAVESLATPEPLPTLEDSLEELFDASWWLAASYDGALTSVVAFGGGFAALSTPPLDDEQSAWPETDELWLSSDGVVWEKAPTQPRMRPWSLSSDGKTLFAETWGEDGTWSIWASGTDSDWRPALTDDDFDHLLDFPWDAWWGRLDGWGPWGWWGPWGDAVAAGPPGAVIFGVDRDGLIAAWFWDGERFLAADVGAIATFTPDSALLEAIALDDRFLLLIYDFAAAGNDETPLMVSFSSTGASWSDPQPPPPASPLSWPEPHVLDAASVDGKNVVALDAGYGLWITDDGSSWSEIVLGPDGHWSPEDGPYGYWFTDDGSGDVTGGGRGWIISFEEDLWYSPDGERWAALGNPKGGPVGSEATLIVADEHLLVFRRVGPDTSWSTEVWRREIDPRALSLTPTATADPAAREWNPILTETRARQAPPIATCSPGTNPGLPGPSDQPQPDPRRYPEICEPFCDRHADYRDWDDWGLHDPYRDPRPAFADLAAAFDRHAGRIVYLDAQNETWTFDVCTNTWHEMNPTGALSAIKGNLVYDTDSDATVALHGYVSVYDANSNTWTQPYPRLVEGHFLVEPRGAVYDPLSGLILTITRPTTTRPDDHWTLWAYDVDTDTWTAVGPLLFERTTPCCAGIDLVGYLPGIDRLLLTTHDEFQDGPVRIDPMTLLLDPRTGQIVTIPTDTPVVNPAFLPIRRHGQGHHTVYVTNPDGSICGFDTATSTWTSCFAGPGPSGHIAFEALVDDPINNRLILINGIPDTWWDEDAYVPGVWAIDHDTGEPQELAPATADP